MAKGELFNQKEMRRLWGVSAMGMELAGGIAIMALLGWAADKQLNSSPWLLFVGIVIGAVGGGLNFFRRAKAMMRTNGASASRRPNAPRATPPARGPEAYEQLLEEERARTARGAPGGAQDEKNPEARP